jgi:hypothetical protein
MLARGPHGYADMNISVNITDMNTMFFSWIISMNISVLLKFYGYEYGYAPNIHGYRRYLGSSLPSIQNLSLRKEKIQKKRGDKGPKETRGDFITCNIQHTQFGKHLLFSDLVLIDIASSQSSINLMPLTGPSRTPRSKSLQLGYLNNAAFYTI